MDPQAIKASYARLAPIYDNTFGQITNKTRKRTIEYINEHSFQNLLEVGVGTGLALPMYHSKNDITGIDFSEDMLRQAQKRVSDLQLSHVSDLRQMDARELAFDNDTFDIVVAMHIISVVPEPNKVMREMIRVCKPGGKIIVTNHFAKKTGVSASITKSFAPITKRIGWHSDFYIDVVMNQNDTKLIEKRSLPPVGMMKLVALEKTVV